MMIERWACASLPPLVPQAGWLAGVAFVSFIRPGVAAGIFLVFIIIPFSLVFYVSFT